MTSPRSHLMFSRLLFAAWSATRESIEPACPADLCAVPREPEKQEPCRTALGWKKAA